MKDYLLYSDLAEDLTPDSKVFYVNGCSMTYGQELVGVSKYTSVFDKFDYMPDDYHHERLKRCWAGIVHRELFPDHLFYNAAMGGASNHRIYRSTATHLGLMLEAGVKPENIFVIIMFTNSCRLGLYDNNVGKWVDLFLTGNYPKEQELYNRFADMYLENFVSNKSVAEESLLTILSMQNLLKANGIKYGLCEGIPMMLLYQGAEPPQVVTNPLYKSIDMSRWLMYSQNAIDRTKTFWCTNFGSWATSNGFELGPGFHPLESAHEAWAMKLIAEIKQKRETFL